MALKIRLTRGGAHKRPFFRLVVAQDRAARDGKFIEKLGIYDPQLDKDHPDWFRVNAERVTYWVGVGAQLSDRVQRLMATKGLAEKPTISKQTRKNQPKKKALERLAKETPSEAA